MGDSRALLAAPPIPLAMALGGMSQGLGLPCQVEKAGLPEYLLDFIAEGDQLALARYLDAVLSDDAISNAALHDLFLRLGPRDYLDTPQEARAVFASLQRALHQQMNVHD